MDPICVFIASNTTGMTADVAVWTDPEARDHCVVVIKGTFEAGPLGEMQLAPVQQPLVYVDEHFGSPENTSVRFENDFAPAKPGAEVLVVGKAVAPGGKPAERVLACLEIQGRRKDLLVVGDRRWRIRAGIPLASEPEPFLEMPLVFERAFGGTDESLGSQQVATEHRNPIGLGFHQHRSLADIDGSALPNIERPERPLTGPRDRPPPIGVGVVGRAWQQRAAYAGTYDQRWLDETCPFLPSDFDLHYFMGAPHDQWLSRLEGGELIRCWHMADSPVVDYRIPEVTPISVEFRFVDRTDRRVARLDTVIVQPHLREASLLWRAAVPLGKKLTDLREILIGERPRGDRGGRLGYRDGKPHFRGLGATVDWLRRKRGEA